MNTINGIIDFLSSSVITRNEGLKEWFENNYYDILHINHKIYELSNEGSIIYSEIYNTVTSKWSIFDTVEQLNEDELGYIAKLLVKLSIVEKCFN